MPNIEFIDKEEIIDGNVVGQYGLDYDTSRIVLVKWGVLFRKYNSFAFTAEFLDSIEAEYIYVVDKGSSDVYLFRKSDYQEGPLVKEGGDFQYVLDKDEALEIYDSLDEILT